MTITLMLAAALGFADLDALDRSIASFTGALPGEAGGAGAPLDRRLRLRACSTPPALAWQTARRDAVLVQCPDAGSWRFAVPVLRSAAAAPVPEAPAINRGEAVTISVEGDGFAVSRPGQALEAGPVGGWIHVTPQADAPGQVQPLRVQVVRPGLVRIPME
jgi:flagellar basal body P-ring formation protein FlgA